MKKIREMKMKMKKIKIWINNKLFCCICCSISWYWVFCNIQLFFSSTKLTKNKMSQITKEEMDVDVETQSRERSTSLSLDINVEVATPKEHTQSSPRNERGM